MQDHLMAVDRLLASAPSPAARSRGAVMSTSNSWARVQARRATRSVAPAS
jgi:hypothetical protein